MLTHLAVTELHAAAIHLVRRDSHATQQQAETTITLCAEHKFASFLGQATILRGWALAEQGFHTEGIAQIRWGVAACQATGAALFRPLFLSPVIDACWKAVRTEEGVSVLAQALATVDRNGERFYEAELQRLKGELTLQGANQKPVLSVVEGAKGKKQKKLSVVSSRLPVPNLRPLTSSTQEAAKEAEGCFLKAIDIAREQQAKSLELRASTSLAHLWQQQGKTKQAHKMLTEIYGWFTEGFETKDLQEAKELLKELSH